MANTQFLLYVYFFGIIKMIFHNNRCNKLKLWNCQGEAGSYELNVEFNLQNIRVKEFLVVIQVSCFVGNPVSFIRF